MRTLIHIGAPKCGSTALQEMLHEHRECLCESGVLYPVSPCAEFDDERHSFLVPLVRNGGWPRLVEAEFQGDREKAKEVAQLVLENIKGQIQREQPELVVLSTEYLCVWEDDDYGDRLSQVTDEIGGRTEILAYFRDPVADYVSSAQQVLKHSSQLIPLRPRAVKSVIERYETISCAGVEVRGFHPALMKRGNVCADFSERFLPGVELPVDAEPENGSFRKNVTISAEAMAIAQSHRRAMYAGRDDEKISEFDRFFTALKAEDATLADFQKPKLKAEFREELYCKSTDFLWLRNTYGIEFPDAPYEVMGRSHTGRGNVQDVTELFSVNHERMGELRQRVNKRLKETGGRFLTRLSKRIARIRDRFT